MSIKFRNSFGISFSSGPEDWASVVEKIPSDIFNGVEIPGSSLDDLHALSAVKSKGLCFYGIRNIFPSSFTGSIADQPEVLVRDFVGRLALTAGKLAALPCSNMSLDLSLETVFGKPNLEESRVGLIKEILPYLHRNNLFVLLPVRVPLQHQYSTDSMYSFLSRTMSGQVRFSLDIFPHETAKEKNHDKHLRWLRFDTNLVRLVYEPEAGNVMVEKIIETWMAAFEKLAITAPVVFCPKISDSNRFIGEMEKLEELLRSFIGKKNNENEN